MTSSIYKKYNTHRTDGKSAPGERHANCEYFVLDLTHDVHCIDALTGYAVSCSTTHPKLSRDIFAKIKILRGQGYEMKEELKPTWENLTEDNWLPQRDKRVWAKINGDSSAMHGVLLFRDNQDGMIVPFVVMFPNSIVLWCMDVSLHNDEGVPSEESLFEAWDESRNPPKPLAPEDAAAADVRAVFRANLLKHVPNPGWQDLTPDECLGHVGKRVWGRDSVDGKVTNGRFFVRVDGYIVSEFPYGIALDGKINNVIWFKHCSATNDDGLKASIEGVSK